jgi:hypothetical protein
MDDDYTTLDDVREGIKAICTVFQDFFDRYDATIRAMLDAIKHKP